MLDVSIGYVATDASQRIGHQELRELTAAADADLSPSLLKGK